MRYYGGMDKDERERGNNYVGRSVLVPAVENDDSSFSDSHAPG